jgi:hypothetical protein
MKSSTKNQFEIDFVISNSLINKMGLSNPLTKNTTNLMAA